MEPARLLAQQLNEERKRRKEAEAWAERFYETLCLSPVALYPWERAERADYERWKAAQ